MEENGIWGKWKWRKMEIGENGIWGKWKLLKVAFGEMEIGENKILGELEIGGNRNCSYGTLIDNVAM